MAVSQGQGLVRTLDHDMKNRKETANHKYTYGHVTVNLSNPSKPTRARGEIMAFSDSSEAICSVSSISISGYSGGESTKSELCQRETVLYRCWTNFVRLFHLS